MTWHPEQPCVGFWMVRCCRECPEVAARIYYAHTTADPVSGEPMDRSPFLAAQIGLENVGVRELWAMLEYCESSQRQRHGMVNPPVSNHAPRNNRAPALKWAPLAKWKQTRARRITAAQYAAEIEWLQWASRNAPKHPDLLYRRPVDRQTAPVPRFTT